MNATIAKKPTYCEFFRAYGELYVWIVNMLCDGEGEYVDVSEGVDAEDEIIRNVISTMKAIISREDYDNTDCPFTTYEKQLEEAFDAAHEDAMSSVDVVYKH